MICPVCGIGIMEPEIDSTGFSKHYCDYCSHELETQRDTFYNKAVSSTRSSKDANTKY